MLYQLMRYPLLSLLSDKINQLIFILNEFDFSWKGNYDYYKAVLN